MKTKIIYEDAHIMICYKPAGLATQSGRIGQSDVVSELKNYLKVSYLGVVHRLDQPVEGLLVFGKTKEASAKLTCQLTQGSLNKQYYGVICGNPMQNQAELVDYLRKNHALNMAEVVTQQEQIPIDAKKAILQYKVMEQIFVPESLALLDIHIDTGRFHQIRAQLSHAGMALLGDGKYADDAVRESAVRLGVRNVALCAYLLKIRHPISEKEFCYKVQPQGKIFSYFSSL